MARSACRLVRGNSLLFKHGSDLDSDNGVMYGSDSSGDGGGEENLELEVMDLRDSAHAWNLFVLASHHSEAASVPSAFTLDNALAEEIFPVHTKSLVVKEAFEVVMASRGEVGPCPRAAGSTGQTGSRSGPTATGHWHCCA